MNAKRILITVNDGRIAINVLQTDIMRILRATPGLETYLLVHPRKLGYFTRLFADDKVHVVGNEPEPQGRLEFLFATVFLNSIPTRSLRIWQRTRYLGKGKPMLYAVASILRRAGRFRVWRRFLRLLDRRLAPTPRFYRELMDRVKPDLVFATNMMSRDDVALMRLAAERGVKTVGMVKSWDGPTTKLFVRTIPDLILVNNSTIKDELVSLYDVPPERVEAIGIPHYDGWKRADLAMPREEFFRELGLDPGKRTVVYAAAGDWMNSGDAEIVRQLSAATRDGRLPGVQILVRLHPKYASAAEGLAGLPHVVVMRPGTDVTGELVHWEYEDKDVRLLVSTLRWTDVIVNTASTFTIDAAVEDRPIVLIAFDGAGEEPYDRSVVRYYDREHMRQIVESGGAKLARSMDGLLDAIRSYLDDPSLDAAGRARIREDQCYRLDGQAGRRGAEALLRSLESRQPTPDRVAV